MRRPGRAAPLALGLALAAGPAPAADWATVAAIFTERCVLCHSGPDAPLGLALDSHAAALAGGETGPVLVARDPDASALMHRVTGRAEPRMPLDGPPWLAPAEVAGIEAWIRAGMPGGEGGGTAAAQARPEPGAPVLYSDVAPIFKKRCIECHSDNSKLGAPPEGLRLDRFENVLAGGERLAVVPGDPGMSALWRHVSGVAAPRMPLDGPPWLGEDDLRLVHDWIAQGAPDAEGRPAPVPAGRELRLRGVLTAPDAIDGARFDPRGARVDKAPRVGDAAELRGVVMPDGSVRATRIRRR